MPEVPDELGDVLRTIQANEGVKARWLLDT